MANLSKAKPEYLSMSISSDELADIKKLASLLGVKKATAVKIVLRSHIKAMVERLFLELKPSTDGDPSHV